jgi:hypothetical protein
MSDTVNQVIDRIICDRDFARRIRERGVDVFRGSQLTQSQAQRIVDVVHAGAPDDEPAMLELTRLAKFEPLFGSYSGSCTKTG